MQMFSNQPGCLRPHRCRNQQRSAPPGWLGSASLGAPERIPFNVGGDVWRNNAPSRSSMAWLNLAQFCAVAAKAVEYAALQALCEVKCACEFREAFGVRRIPPLFAKSVHWQTLLSVLSRESLPRGGIVFYRRAPSLANGRVVLEPEEINVASQKQEVGAGDGAHFLFLAGNVDLLWLQDHATIRQ